MNRKSTVLVLIILLGIAIIGYLSVMQSQTNNIKQLTSIEVRNYNGTDLSSIANFQEEAIKGTQYVDNVTYRLNITGLVDHPESYTYQQVISQFQSYKQVVTLNCVEGWSVTILWQGVLVKDLINEAGINSSATTVIFMAVDGYSTSFPIDYIMNNSIILAYKMNNVTLPPELGFPFQLVAQSEWGYKWIKWVNQIEISSDTNYRGYWESRGYSNSGELNSSFLGP
jgi:DMSO/TMAO reductase YedYZ molybdopterin-dependent catalytic subunit